MDPSEGTPSCSEPNIECSVTEVTSGGPSAMHPITENGKANANDGQSQNVSSVSGDLTVNTEDGGSLPHHAPQTSENMPESSSMNDSEQNGNEGNEDEDMDSASEISDFSDFSQESWHPSQGPIAWVQEQMRQGQNARSILEDLVPPGTMIPNDIDPIMLWRLIINIVSEPPKRKKLENINTLEDVIGLLKSCNKIIVLTGAGVSVSCGIPDFRSRDGVYARLAVDFPNLPDPQAMFDIHFFRSDPRPFFKFAKEIYPGQFKPSLCHHFIRLIESQGKLLRNYTQNIDTLEQEAGIERVVQCHGSFATATCTNCKRKVKADVVREDIFNQVIPKCPQCPEGTENAIMKPDIVFFGESLPEDFHKQMAQDKDECDLLIVIGSSLKVRPVALIPNSVPEHVPQILINRERLHYLNFDVELLGNCDDIVGELCHRLGTGWDQLAPPGVPPLTEVVMSSLPTPPTSPTSPSPTTSSSSPTSNRTKLKETDVTGVKKTKEQGEISQSSTSPIKVEEGADSEMHTVEPDQNLMSVADCRDSKDECQTTAKAVHCDRGDFATGDLKPESSMSSSVESVSSSNTPLTSNVSTNKTEGEGKTVVASDALSDEVSTTTSTNAKTPHSHSSADDQPHKEDQGSTESDIVSSTSSEPKTHHHKPHHHSSSNHHNHKNSHHHHHNDHHHQHQHNHRHSHLHHNSSGKSPTSDRPHSAESDPTEPVEKRPRLEAKGESLSSSSSSSKGGNNARDGELTSSTTTPVAATTSHETEGQREEEEVDDELEEMRKMWQGRKNRVSLAQRLPENQYLFLPPNRYVFKGAEVFSDSDEDNDPDSEDNSDGEVEHNAEDDSNDVSAEAEQQDAQQQVVEIDEMPVKAGDMTGEQASSLPSSSKMSLPVANEVENIKDRTGDVSSTNNDPETHKNGASPLVDQ